MDKKIDELLQPEGHLAPMRLVKTAPGTCPECGRVHDTNIPHDRDSLTYQYSFYNKFGRYPTWADAMAHCPEDVKAAWIKELKELGVEVK